MSIQDSHAQKPLHKIFTDVPPRYDRINCIFTWGMDKRWRRRAASACLSGSPQRVLDLACGTGDLSLEIAAGAKSAIDISGLDFSEPMLELAGKKARDRGLLVNYLMGDAAELPFPDGHFDVVGIAFAFRNLTYQHPRASRHIAEILRVLRPGGRFVIVESSQPENQLIRALDHCYVRAFVYPVGWWLSGNKGAFKYLAVSASHYYTPKALADLLLRTGFRRVTYQRLFFGASAIHIAVK